MSMWPVVILMAATLMRIKARMLIPRKPLNEEGQEIDPRQELVERLLEYKRYKSVLDDLRWKKTRLVNLDEVTSIGSCARWRHGHWSMS
ncbi:MAG: segregation/condensation protein A [Saprospiraceae bacterium]